MTGKRQLVVFDFDWSFVGTYQDTDRYVFECLSPELRILMRSRKSSMQWTDNVADCLHRLHEQGLKRSEIEGAFHTLPLHPAMKRAVVELHSRTPTTFLLLSNSNSVFISTILEHHSLSNVFIEVITNPAEWQGDLISLRRRVDPSGPQHGCKVGCSANMCKGAELDAFLGRHGGRDAFARIIYVGDGANDFCPVLRLDHGDQVFARSGRALAKLIAEQGESTGLKAEPQQWGGAWEAEQLFRSLPPLEFDDSAQKQP